VKHKEVNPRSPRLVPRRTDWDTADRPRKNAPRADRRHRSWTPTIGERLEQDWLSDPKSGTYGKDLVSLPMRTSWNANAPPTGPDRAALRNRATGSRWWTRMYRPITRSKGSSTENSSTEVRTKLICRSPAGKMKVFFREAAKGNSMPPQDKALL
jgi:hypothetical protein